jgi:hypothetical protein
MFGYSNNNANGFFPVGITLIAVSIYITDVPVMPVLVSGVVFVAIYVILLTALSIPLSKATFTQAVMEGNFRYAHAR